jgi:hypothetical protein
MTSALVDSIAEVYAGTVDGPRLVAAFRDALVVVPTDARDAVLTITDRGLTWVPAFTDTAALARFALARGDGAREWAYLTTRGSRLQDVLAPALGRNAGIAVDVGSQRPVFFPPTNPG